MSIELQIIPKDQILQKYINTMLPYHIINSSEASSIYHDKLVLKRDTNYAKRLFSI